METFVINELMKLHAAADLEVVRMPSVVASTATPRTTNSPQSGFPFRPARTIGRSAPPCRANVAGALMKSTTLTLTGVWVGDRRIFIVGYTPGAAPFGCYEDEFTEHPVGGVAVWSTLID
jgi:hypothetical protein